LLPDERRGGRRPFALFQKIAKSLLFRGQGH
jgi:hypothetical protein